MITKEQMANALEAPAVFSNRFYFTAMGAAVRVAFCEVLGADGDPNQCEKARFTVVLPNEEFVKFGGEILKIANMIQSRQNLPTEDVQ